MDGNVSTTKLLTQLTNSGMLYHAHGQRQIGLPLTRPSSRISGSRKKYILDTDANVVELRVVLLQVYYIALVSSRG